MNDLISRQAAIYAIVNTPSKVGYHDNSEVARYGATFRQHEILDIIERLSSIQPEPQKGHWIGSDGSYICSECGSNPIDFINTTGASFDAYVEIPMDYCPSCGADMRGGNIE